MQLSDMANEAVTLLGAVASRGATVAQGVAIRVLGDMAASRFERAGYGQAWADFKGSPHNDSLARHLLQQLLHEDPAFRAEFGKALRAAQAEKAPAAGHQTVKVTGPGKVQIGDRGDSFKNSRVANRGGTYHEGDIHRQDNRVSNKKSNAGAVVALAVVALVVIVFILAKGVPALLNRVHDGGLNANSTCAQFLNTDEATEAQALVDIAMSKGIGGFGSPLALPEIRYECSSEPSMTLGAIIERDKGQY